MDIIETEAVVGSFRADILAEEQETGRTVVIENQFESTDHQHLGQSLVYTAGKEADVVVWIAERFKEEHTSVFRWLNNRTDENVAFFAIEVSLHQISNSPYAIDFTAVEKPDEWKGVQGETESLYHHFWSLFIERANDRNLPHFTGQSPSTNASYNISIGQGDIYLRSTARLKQGSELATRMIFKDRESFADINEDEFKESLSESLGELENKTKTDFSSKNIVSRLDYDPGENRSFDQITIRNEISAPKDKSNWTAYHDWLIDTSLLLKETLEKEL